MVSNIEHKSNKRKQKIENKAEKANSSPKKKRPAKKIEKPVTFAARTRLEPRLSLPSSGKNKKKQETNTNIEKDKKLVVSLNANEIEEHLKHMNLKQLKSPKNANERSKISTPKSISPMKKNNHRALLKNIENYFGDEEDFKKFIIQSKQRTICKGFYWTDREIRDLAYGLQQHGFSDAKKLAAEVKTKTENDIKDFLKSRTLEKRRVKTPLPEAERHRGRPKSTWNCVSQEVLGSWPVVRKWRRLAYDQMLSYTRTKDYSKPVISALCNKFYEEEPEPADAQVINVKLIYKYMSDCMNGVVPPQLPPKESAVVLDLLREVRLIPLAYDFEEERQFLKDFRKSITFKPFEVKDEFKKRVQQGPVEMDDPNTVSVPDEVFLELNRHKRLLQSFNPLITPVWMVQKAQEHLEKYFEESNVYTFD